MNVKINEKDKIKIDSSEDLYEIMQRILLRENKIDREKEHFWIVGMNVAGVILYIELISMGSVRATLVEPMNVFRVAILKGATRVVAVHNHPSGNLKPSAPDMEVTDRLIQVGKIIEIKLEDHLIITPTNFLSFNDTGIMDELEKSTQFVPTYKLIEKIKSEEKNIRIELEKNFKERLKKQEDSIKSAVHNLLENHLTIEQIANILQMSQEEIKKISKQKKSN